ncbi:MAG: choice-of-anchor J domain-containing protein [Xanthomonadales bacterium]|nr:hypothetical protein [Xanthomonadales bacterium]MCC6593911.1 choice-of-anchor J domain-containing protein [Xanthomonadales bacterium]MCE7932049.1 hypothetical protein [Xanthomonadales bacterium PRO6]
MKRTLRYTTASLLASALLLPLAAGAQTGARVPAEAGPKGPVTPLQISPFAPNATLTESFDVLGGVSPNQCPTGWTCDNNSVAGGSSSWFQGNSGVFPAQAGPATGYIAANFNNTTGTNTISNWLISPQVNFTSTAGLRFWTRTASGTFPDRLEVRISTNGASVNVGTLPTDVGDFTTVVTTINPSLMAGAGACPPAAGAYPTTYCEIVLTNANGIPTSGSGRIAFRYFVTNGGPGGSNSDYIGIDTFSYNDAVLPPPTSPLQNFDGVTPPAQPGGWTATSSTSANWATATPGTPTAQSPANVEAVTGNVALTDAVLTSETFAVTAVPAQIGFFRSQAAPGLENGFDGMVMEVSVNGGAFADAVTAGGSFTSGGYNGTISSGFSSPIAGRAAWTGTQAAFTQSIYLLPASAAVGSTVQFRWRMATDSSVSSGVTQIDTLTSTGVAPTADISVTLTDTPDPVAAGTNLTYNVTVTNNGPGAADAAGFTLPLPAGTSFVSVTPSAGGLCNNGSPVSCSWAGATAAGTSRTATVVALVAANVANGSTLSATATASSTTVDLVAGNNSATATTAVSTSADLATTLTASANAVPVNTPVTFSATSTNNGPSDAQNVVLSVSLSPDFRYSSHSASAGATCTFPQIGNSGVISCTWAGATAPGGTRTLSVVAFSNNVNNNTVSASTTSGTADPNTANNTAAVSVTVGTLVSEIPSLGRNALLLLGVLLALGGLVAVRRHG